MLVFAGDALVPCTVVKYKCLLWGDCWLFHDFEFAVCLILLLTLFFFFFQLLWWDRLTEWTYQVEEESSKAELRPISPPEKANSFSLAKISEEKWGLLRPFQNAREKCSCWVGCLGDQCVLSPERCNHQCGTGEEDKTWVWCISGGERCAHEANSKERARSQRWSENHGPCSGAHS